MNNENLRLISIKCKFQSPPYHNKSLFLIMKKERKMLETFGDDRIFHMIMCKALVLSFYLGKIFKKTGKMRHFKCQYLIKVQIGQKKWRHPAHILVLKD